MWGQKICDPDPLCIKAQSLSRGEQLPRTHNESPKKGLRIWPRTILCSAPHRTPEGKDELSVEAGQVKKLTIQ